MEEARSCLDLVTAHSRVLFTGLGQTVYVWNEKSLVEMPRFSSADNTFLGSNCTPMARALLQQPGTILSGTALCVRGFLQDIPYIMKV